jgi:hypothetical protein
VSWQEYGAVTGIAPPPALASGGPLTAEAPPLGGLEARRPFPARLGPKGNLLYKLVTTTDHKTIGIMYVVTCFAFFFTGGLMALLMRGELATPGLRFLSNEQFNQLFTMHGTIMLFVVVCHPDRVRVRQPGAAVSDRRA